MNKITYLIPFIILTIILSGCLDRQYTCHAPPTGIIATAVSNLYDVKLALEGTSTDIAEVVWTVSKGASTQSQTIKSSPWNGTFSLNASGTYAVSAMVKNTCGEASILQTTYSVNCPQVSGIAIGTGSAFLSATLALNGTSRELGEISKVEWSVVLNGITVYSRTQTAGPFSVSTPSLSAYEGVFVVTAKVISACDGTYTRTGSFNIKKEYKLLEGVIEAGAGCQGNSAGCAYSTQLNFIADTDTRLMPETLKLESSTVIGGPGVRNCAFQWSQVETGGFVKKMVGSAYSIDGNSGHTQGQTRYRYTVRQVKETLTGI
jgi:hypothetical protein